MNFLNLEYFLIIVEEGSFSKAARRLLISQQTLSEHVKKLEEEVDAALFIRGEKLKLTSAGEYFMDSVKKIFITKEKTLKNIEQVTNLNRKHITIGINCYESPPFLPDLLKNFFKNYPDFKCSIIERDDINISKNMDDIDLYISYTPIDRETEAVPLVENERCVAIGRNSLFIEAFKDDWPLVKNELIDKKDLRIMGEMPFIKPKREHGYKCRYLNLIFSHFKIEPHIGFSSDNGDLNASMCLSGAGIDIIPMSYFYHKYWKHIKWNNKNMEYFEIDIPEEIQSFPVVSYNKSKRLHQSEKLFIENAKDFMLEQLSLVK